MASRIKKPTKSSKAIKITKSSSKSKKVASKTAQKSSPKKTVKKTAPQKISAKKAKTTLTLVKKNPLKLLVKAKPKKDHTKSIVQTTQVTSKDKAPSQVKSISLSDLTVGSLAPNFTMPATLVGTIGSSSLKGKPYVLYFYPKDDTSGCTAEACEFRNTLPQFNKLNITIVGVSKDTLESHEKFGRKYNLTFPLASDSETSVCESFGTWVQKSMYGRSYMGIERSTFLIDGQGIIRAVWRKVSVPGHIENVCRAAENL